MRLAKFKTQENKELFTYGNKKDVFIDMLPDFQYEPNIIFNNLKKVNNLISKRQ